MASKKKSNPKSANAGEKAPLNLNKIMIRVLALVVISSLVWEALQTVGNKEVPKLKVSQVLKLDSNIKGVGTFVPWGAAAFLDGKIAVADNQGNRILLFDRAGNFVKSWGTPGARKDQFHEPSGMTADSQGHVYVMDAWNSAIKGYDEKGKQTSVIDLTNMGFFGPRGIAFDGAHFAIADTGSHRIAIVGLKGDVVTSWGTHGDADGQMNGPLAVAVDSKGYYVADTDNNRVQWLDPNGKKIRYAKLKGAVQSVTVDKQGRVYACTKADDGKTYLFDTEGHLTGELVDQSGSAEPFKDAKSLAITPDNLLLVTSGGAVYLYQLPAPGQK